MLRHDQRFQSFASRNLIPTSSPILFSAYFSINVFTVCVLTLEKIFCLPSNFILMFVEAILVDFFVFVLNTLIYNEAILNIPYRTKIVGKKEDIFLEDDKYFVRRNETTRRQLKVCFFLIFETSKIMRIVQLTSTATVCLF